ncbi:hypothetical protein Athai_39830 [Actinocatenispora thailandica]|uniref:Uncharacterized protein n=1 Tax=Actinocatenispora thailandica TaxID=227318 RepID=A0A7R7DRC2_9ACTN|nr:hypothetical protein [Actinocatenispora thailandica]BCJ36480.1 hypothetical protein Athai_39830 [Actinocatenispora thailandica]
MPERIDYLDDPDAPTATRATSSATPATAVRYFPVGEAPRLFSQQHRDALTDLAAGRSAVFR